MRLYYIHIAVTLFREYHSLGVYLLAVDDEGVEVNTCAELCAVDGQAIVRGGDVVTLQLFALHVEDADVSRMCSVGNLEADGGLAVKWVRGVLIESGCLPFCRGACNGCGGRGLGNLALALHLVDFLLQLFDGLY